MYRYVLALSKAALEKWQEGFRIQPMLENPASKANLPISLILILEKHQMPYFIPIQLTLFWYCRLY